LTVFLLDTNVCIQYLRNRDPTLLARIQAHPPDEIRLCSVVVGELYYGAYKGPRPTRRPTLRY
jgi:tRNA(fMet)-specific endonuclease VapC